MKGRPAKTGFWSTEWEDPLLRVQLSFRYGPLGWLDAPMEHLQKLTSDPAGYVANRLGIEKQRLLDWMEWRKAGGGCTGTTKAGRPCRYPHINDDGPASWTKGVSDRCQIHEQRSGA